MTLCRFFFFLRICIWHADAKFPHVGEFKPVADFGGIHALGDGIDQMLLSEKLRQNFLAGNAVERGQDHRIFCHRLFRQSGGFPKAVPLTAKNPANPSVPACRPLSYQNCTFSVAIYAFFFKAGNPFRVSHKGHMILSHFLHKKSPYNIPRAPIPTIVTFSILFIPYCPSFCMIILSYSHFLSLSRHAGLQRLAKERGPWPSSVSYHSSKSLTLDSVNIMTAEILPYLLNKIYALFPYSRLSFIFLYVVFAN